MNENSNLFTKEERYKALSGKINTQKLLEDAKNILNPEVQLMAIRAARKLLSCSTEPPISDFLEIGILPLVVSCLERHDYEILQYEAAWILTNITCGTTAHTLQVVEAGAVPILLQNLSSHSKDVSFQALWALGNIIGDSAKFRDYVLEHGIIESLVIVMENVHETRFYQKVGWICVNLCRTHDQPPSSDALEQIMTVIKMLIVVDDKKVISCVLWAIIYITDQGNPARTIQLVINNGIISTILSFLHKSSRTVIHTCLKAMRNLVSGTQSQTDSVINLVCYKRLTLLLYSRSYRTRRNVVNFLLSLFSINDGTTLAILGNENMWLGIMFNLKTDRVEHQSKAIEILKCVISKGSRELFSKVIDARTVCSLWSLMETSNNDIISDLEHCLSRIQERFSESIEQSNNKEL